MLFFARLWRDDNDDELTGRQRVWLWFGGLAMVAAVWAFLILVVKVPRVFLPGPLAVARAWWRLLSAGELHRALLASMLRIALGMTASVIVGVPVGTVMGVVPRINSLLAPVVLPLRYIPATAALPLLILWAGIGETMKYLFLFFGTVVYLIPLVRDAFRDVRSSYQEVARDLRMSRWQTIRYILMPAAAGQVIDAVIVCSGIGWSYVVLAELINPQTGLGYILSISGRLQRSDEVLACILTIGTVALVTDRLLTFIRRRLISW
jgi:ABC-type nitrate/sulfonate/bicarbonate transport system permease component